MKTKSLYWLSLTTDKQYSYSEYTNHGYGGEKHGYKDLPSEGYPYTIIYSPSEIPVWQQ